MDAIQEILYFGENFLQGGATLIKWLITPLFKFDFSYLSNNGIELPFLNNALVMGSFSPLGLLSISGLIIFINVAFWKWLLS